MRKILLMLGILLVTTIFISGPAIAAEYYIIQVDSYYMCSNQDNAIGAPDDSYATIGYQGNDGWIILDFGSGTAMDPDQLFTVYGTDGAGVTESYDVTVLDQTIGDPRYLGSGIDTQDEDFTTPSDLGKSWRYVKIEGYCGDVSLNDTLTGPEIDAIGYET